MTTPSANQPVTRSVELEVEVAGTPEQVWQAIATGPGIEAWFMPNEIEEREGGRVAYDMGFGMQQTGTISAWEPPRRLAVQEQWEGSSFATEFLVEGRSGSTCVVRLVSSITAAGDFSDELDQMREGWIAAFRVLQLYLERWAGEPAANVMVAHETHLGVDHAWRELLGALGIAPPAAGEQLDSGGVGAPRLAGAVDQVFEGGATRGFLLVLEEPAPGVGSVTVFPDGEHVNAVVHLYFYGEGAPKMANEQATAWKQWLAGRFPAPEVSAPEVAQQTG